MRAFIAIGLPEEIKIGLAQLQEKLKESGADVKWVAPGNIHLTLKFLGEINQEQLCGIQGALQETAQDSPAFGISISSLGVFPKADYPRVVWAGIDQGSRECERIAAALEEKLEKTGLPKEKRKYSSHITIGRVRSLLNRDKLIKGLNELEGYLQSKKLSFTVVRLALYKSTLRPDGPVYEIQREASLKAS